MTGPVTRGDDAPGGAPAIEGPGRESPRRFRPGLFALLRAFRLDVAYERGDGCHLYYRDDRDRTVEVLDLVGGYGSLLVGHSHPELVAEARRLLAAQVPMHAQGSVSEAGQRLADELARRARGDFSLVLANSGAEAVEAALKHAMLETGGRTVVALEGAFHGKTLGAVQLTANPTFREPFRLDGLVVRRVRPNDIDHLRAGVTDARDLMGCIFEPVQGEGGVRPLDAAFVRQMAALCRERGVPLIADECQTGVGRTGTFLASEWLGVEPDYVILSKGLGGGLAKIAAVLIRRSRYREAFDLLHTSTYAADEVSTSLALRALDLVDDALMEQCRDAGELLQGGLRALAHQYPDVIADVRGRGLLIGVEFRPLPQSASVFLRCLSAQSTLLFVLAGYLLHRHRIRVAPTLSDPFTLRLEPSALIGHDTVDVILDALENVCRRLRHADSPALIECLVDHQPALRAARMPLLFDGAPVAYDSARFRLRQGRVPDARVAWLFHLVTAEDIVAIDPAFARVAPDEREVYLDALADQAAPVVMSAVDIRSRTGEAVRVYPILLPVTSCWMKHAIDRRAFRRPRSLIARGLDTARRLGCAVVSLGQYTSIVTRSGAALRARGAPVTTGNSYAVALTAEALERARGDAGADPGRVLAVVGALGNVGSGVARLLGPGYRRTILLGSDRPGTRARLEGMARRIGNGEVATDPAALRDADTVVSAVSATTPVLGPEHFAPGAVVCDVSVPASVRPGTGRARADLRLLRGGIARLPNGEDLEIAGFHLAPGQVYACLAEGMLLGLDGARDATLTGPITAERVHRMAALAHRHGFQLAEDAPRPAGRG